MKHRRISGLCVIAVGIAVLAGCGGSQSASAPALSLAPAAPPSAPPVPPPPDISQRDMLENLLVSGNEDWLPLSSMIGDLSVYGTHFGAARFSASCANGSCTMTTGTIVGALQPTRELEINETLTVTDFGIDGFFSDWTTLAEASRRGPCMA